MIMDYQFNRGETVLEAHADPHDLPVRGSGWGDGPRRSISSLAAGRLARFACNAAARPDRNEGRARHPGHSKTGGHNSRSWLQSQFLQAVRGLLFLDSGSFVTSNGSRTMPAGSHQQPVTSSRKTQTSDGGLLEGVTVGGTGPVIESLGGSSYLCADGGGIGGGGLGLAE